MSRWPERWVRLAARLLPAHVRDRYREEWMADLAGARELGIPTSSIAIGALLFSATIDRSAPEISGIPLSIAARIHARRGTALLLSAGVLAAGAYVSGAQGSVSHPTLTETLVSLLTAVIPIVAALAAVAGLMELWRAAYFASTLAKVCAALATVGVTSAPLAVVGGWFLVPLAILCLIAAGILGVIVWAGSSRPVTPPTLPATEALRLAGARKRFPRWAFVLILVVGIIATAGLAIMPGISILLLFATAAIGAVVLAVRAIRTRTSGIRSWAGALSIGLMALTVFLMVGAGTLDLLVLSPQWMAPGYSLRGIYAALSPADLASGVVMIGIWIAFWSVAALFYLVVAVAGIRRATPSTHWMLVTGFAIIAAMVFFQFWAGFSLGNSISDTLPPFYGGRSDVGVLYGIVGQFSLVFALWGAIAPGRADGALRQAQGPDVTQGPGLTQGPAAPATTASTASP